VKTEQLIVGSGHDGILMLLSCWGVAMESSGGRSWSVWRDEDVRVIEFVVGIDLVRCLRDKTYHEVFSSQTVRTIFTLTVFKKTIDARSFYY
jgi:hypothetical protein